MDARLAARYVVTGGGGGPLPSCDPMPRAGGVAGWRYSQARRCGYHVTRVEVEGDRLEVSALQVRGNAGDHAVTEWERFVIE